MIWLIGGAARCGKSTLALQAQAGLKSPVVPLDSLRQALISIATGKNLASLRLTPSVSQHTLPEWLHDLRERDRVLWQAARGMIDAALSSKNDLIVEGGLWPDATAEYTGNEQVRTVYLVDTARTHAERIRQLARDPITRNNQMRQWSDEQLKAWAKYNIARSKLIHDLAQQHHQPVFDVATDGLAGAQAKAFEQLQAIMPQNAEPSEREP